MNIRQGARDRCCTPWGWLVRLLFAFLLAAAFAPRASAQDGRAVLRPGEERVILKVASPIYEVLLPTA